MKRLASFAAIAVAATSLTLVAASPAAAHEDHTSYWPGNGHDVGPRGDVGEYDELGTITYDEGDCPESLPLLISETVYTGQVTVDTEGECLTVFSDVVFEGGSDDFGLTNSGNDVNGGVVVQYSLFTGGDVAGAYGRYLQIEDSEFTGLPNDGFLPGAGASSLRSYYHDFSTCCSNFANAIQSWDVDTLRQVIITGNYIEVTSSQVGGIYLSPDFGENSLFRVQVRDNFVIGGISDTITIQDSGSYEYGDVDFTGNHYAGSIDVTPTNLDEDCDNGTDDFFTFTLVGSAC